MKKNILVLAAHPDDEVLGCGGTIAKYSKEGHFIHVAFMSDGVFSREGKQDDLNIELESRNSSAKSALKILSLKEYDFKIRELPSNDLKSCRATSSLERFYCWA